MIYLLLKSVLELVLLASDIAWLYFLLVASVITDKSTVPIATDNFNQSGS